MEVVLVVFLVMMMVVLGAGGPRRRGGGEVGAGRGNGVFGHAGWWCDATKNLEMDGWWLIQLESARVLVSTVWCSMTPLNPNSILGVVWLLIYICLVLKPARILAIKTWRSDTADFIRGFY